MKPLIRTLLAASMAVTTAPPAARGQYEFTVVAEYAARPVQFLQSPPINDRGEVAFMHSSDETGQGVAGLFLSRARPNHPLSLVSAGFVDAQSRSLNDAGVVAFSQQGVFITDGRRTRQIADGPDDPETTYHSPAINNRGTVAFAADLDEDGNTVVFLRRTGEPLVAISDGTVDSLNYHSPPAVDDSDRVAFSAYSAKSQSTDIYAFEHSEIVFLYEHGVAPSVSHRGVVAFTRLMPGVSATAVLRGHMQGPSSRDGALVAIAESGGAFTRVLADSVNDRGQVAFRGAAADGGLGIYVGDGTHTLRVIQTGDQVHGRTVSNLSPASINNEGTVALEAIFTDGTAAILRGEREH